MDLNDIEKELGAINVNKPQPNRRVDYSVKNARMKVIVSKLLGVLFFIAIGLFGVYTITYAESASIDSRVAAALAIVYLALGAYVALKLWKTEFKGWLALFFVSLAGIGLPALSALNHGLMVGTLPLIAASILVLIVLYWIKDLYQIKKFGDIFTPKR